MPKKRMTSPQSGVLSTLADSQRFALGKTYITPGAQEQMNRAGLPAIALLALHAQGEWGVLDANDRAENERAVADGSRILSRYELSSGIAVWVITDAVDDNGVRHSTTILLPEEY